MNRIFRRDHQGIATGKSYFRNTPRHTFRWTLQAPKILSGASAGQFMATTPNEKQFVARTEAAAIRLAEKEMDRLGYSAIE